MRRDGTVPDPSRSRLYRSLAAYDYLRSQDFHGLLWAHYGRKWPVDADRPERDPVLRLAPRAFVERQISRELDAIRDMAPYMDDYMYGFDRPCLLKDTNRWLEQAHGLLCRELLSPETTDGRRA